MSHKIIKAILMVDARTLKSQQALVQSGLKLLNKNKEITLSDIAKEAGVGRATLYRLYESREALIEAIALYCLDTFETLTQPIEKSATSYLQFFELMFERVMPFTEETQFLAQLDYFVSASPEIETIIDKQSHQLSAAIDDAKARGEFNKDFPTKWLINYIDALFYTGWCQQREQGSSAKQASDLAFECFKRTVTKS